MTKRRLRLHICDFWKGYRPEECRLINLLRTRFDIELTDQPDFVFYSLFGEAHYRFRCPRIFYSGEPKGPNWNECDFALTSFAIDDPRHFRLPLYWLWGDIRTLCKSEQDVAALLRSKTKFCNFIFSNHRCETRNRFFDMLSKYKRVDAGGKVRNNLGFRIPDKMAFIRDYKFTIAFENSYIPGYTTEKIVEPMWAQTLPIYWGNSLVHLDFNTKSFINFDDHGSLEKLVEHVIEVDQNDELYMDYWRQPWFHDNRVPEHLHDELILDAFDRFVSTPIVPVAQRVPISLAKRAHITWRTAKKWVKSRLRGTKAA